MQYFTKHERITDIFLILAIMVVSEGALKWAMCFYPPLFFQRIQVTIVHKGLQGVDVTIRKSFLNKNYNKSIFGGTIYASTDPFYPVLFYQILIRRGFKIHAWSRSSAIRFFKPANSDLHFKINISDNEISGCEKQLNLTGKYKKSYQVDIFDTNEKLCVSVINEIYVRNLNHPPGGTGTESPQEFKI